MKAVFIDSSGFFAALARDDHFNARAVELFRKAEEEAWHLVTTNYVVQETWALLQGRIGWPAVDDWLKTLLPRCEVVWVDESLHAIGAARCRQARQRRLSLTDCISFEVMHRENIREAIADDEHFAQAGFPPPAAG